MKNSGPLLGRLANALMSMSLWVGAIFLLQKFNLLNDLDPNLLVIASLAAFFFSLTTSPVTWVIKGLGLEVGSNTPDHFQVDKVSKKGETTIIIRDYSRSSNPETINKILFK